MNTQNVYTAWKSTKVESNDIIAKLPNPTVIDETA